MANQFLPGLALLGAGIFVKDQYVSALRKLADVIELKYVWSRSAGPAEEVASMAKDYASPAAMSGEAGLETILNDPSVHAVAIVLPALVQPQVVIRALQAGKHVLQEKPVGGSTEEALKVLEAHLGLQTSRIWAVAENYRFEPALMKASEFVHQIGAIAMVEVIMEAPMTASNPYFSSPWRRDPSFMGGFLVDGGVHYVAGMRLMVGSEVSAVSVRTRHCNEKLPSPDNLAALMQFENGASGVMVVSYSATSRKVSWRVVGAEGTVEVQRGTVEGRHGYTVKNPNHIPDKRSAAGEAIRDLEAIEAMLMSGATNGRPTDVAHASLP